MLSALGSYLAGARSLSAPCSDSSSDRAWKVLLVLLVAADLAFIALHMLHTYSPIASDPGFSLERDRGFGEVFQYVKLFWIVVMLMMLFVFRRRAIFCCWAILFLYLLIDDAASIHERVGERLAVALDYAPMLRLRAEDFGELTVTVVAGATLFLLIGVTHVFSTRAERIFSACLAGFMAALVFFGVVVDMLYIALESMRGSSLIGVIEDGGEMLVVSATCTFVFSVFIRSRIAAASPRRGELGPTGSQTGSGPGQMPPRRG